jgi:hypothetical protein
MQQLGCDYDENKNFGTKVEGVLLKIEAVQPNLIVKEEKGGIRIHPSRPAIAPAPASQGLHRAARNALPRELWIRRVASHIPRCP